MKKILFALLLVSIGVACDRPKVSVVCAGKGGGVDCTLAEVSGRSRVKTCWDVTFGCANGSSASASQCASVDRGAPAVKSITMSEFTGTDRCDHVTEGSLQVRNIHVTRE